MLLHYGQHRHWRGIIMDNQLISGAHGMAGEIGHVVAVPACPMCAVAKKAISKLLLQELHCPFMFAKN